jgi:hypothetical protein
MKIAQIELRHRFIWDIKSYANPLNPPATTAQSYHNLARMEQSKGKPKPAKSHVELRCEDRG